MTEQIPGQVPEEIPEAAIVAASEVLYAYHQPAPGGVDSAAAATVFGDEARAVLAAALPYLNRRPRYRRIVCPACGKKNVPVSDTGRVHSHRAIDRASRCPASRRYITDALGPSGPEPRPCSSGTDAAARRDYRGGACEA